MKWSAAVTVACAAALLLVQHSWADDDTLWSEIAGVETPSKYEQAMREGDTYAVKAARAYISNRYQGRAHARRAAFEYEKASALEPARGEPHFRAAEVLYAHFVSPFDSVETGVDEEEARRAIDHWIRWRQLEPKDPRLISALFRRSLAYTKLGGEQNYKLALKDYEGQLALTDSADTRGAENVAVVMSNAAELYMAVGDLDSAITLYTQALDVNERPLYGAGLALALERDGQATKARQLMNHYLSGKDFSVLVSDSVFFIPEGDAHAYHALAYDARGDYDKAARHYRKFLEYQPDGRYSKIVADRLKAIAPKIEKSGKKPRKLQIEPEMWTF